MKKVSLLAPIVLFAFKRPDHLRCTLQALAANELAVESDLTIICDGPRNDVECEQTDAVRSVARATAGFRSCTVTEREKNYGLAANIITGVTECLNVHDSLIVLEDDLLTSPYFLRYMNDGLAMYEDTLNVACIHGWCFPHDVPDPPETFFLRGADCWGWATWKRAWDVFEPDAGTLLRQLKQQGKENDFTLGGAYNLIGMLQDAKEGKISSWAIRWHASAYLADMYTLHTAKSLVQNIGMDNSGTHCGSTTVFKVTLTDDPVSIYRIPVTENELMRNAIESFYRSINKNVHYTIVQYIKALCKKILPPYALRCIEKFRPGE